MADPYALAADLAARWRSLSEEEQSTADVLLADASAVVRAECPGIDARLTPAEGETEPALDPDLVKAIVCAMVKRAMLSADQAGVSQEQETVGPFARMQSFSNPLGDLYLTRAERRRLGYGGARAGNVGLAANGIFEVP